MRLILMLLNQQEGDIQRSPGRSSTPAADQPLAPAALHQCLLRRHKRPAYRGSVLAGRTSFTDEVGQMAEIRARPARHMIRLEELYVMSGLMTGRQTGRHAEPRAERYRRPGR